MVSDQQMLRQQVLHSILNQRPSRARQTGRYPLLDNQTRQYFRSKNIFFWQLSELIKMLNTQPQIIQFPASKIQQPQSQP